MKSWCALYKYQISFSNYHNGNTSIATHHIYFYPPIPQNQSAVLCVNNLSKFIA